MNAGYIPLPDSAQCAESPRRPPLRPAPGRAVEDLDPHLSRRTAIGGFSMPAISPQGSRTGLVTALVIFVILFVTTTILYIYENAERRNRDQTLTDLTARYNAVVS